MHGRLAGIILGWFLVASTVEAAQPVAPTLAIETYSLPNGLRVVLHRDATVPRVTVAVGYHVGSRNELAGRTGFAHFFEHMMFRGTRNVPNYDIPLQETGAQSNAFTSEDVTVYFETVASNFLERALYLEAERLAFLPTALEKTKFDTEREVVKNERRQSYENRPYGLDEPTILASLYPKGHPYSWPVIGSMADLDRANLADLEQFFNRYYHPGNASLVLSGDFDPAEARRLIAKYFEPIPGGPAPAARTVPEVPPRSAKVTRRDGVQLPRVTWTWPTVAESHPDAPALDVLALVLAGGDASRLHRALVLEKRVAKDASASNHTLDLAGRFQVVATAAEGNDPEKTLDTIEAVISEVLASLRRNPPDAKEVERALAIHEMSVFRSLTSPMGRAIALVSGATRFGDPQSYKKDFERRMNVRPEDLKRVAARYLTPERLVLWTLPAREGESRTPELAAGPSSDSGVETPVARRTPAPGVDWSKLPAPASSRPFRAPGYVRRSLSNGLDVWVAPWKVLPVVDVRLLIPCGSADDPRGKAGLAQLVATLFDKGTTTKTSSELAEELESLGIGLGAGVSGDIMSSGFETVVRNLDPALRLLGEVLTAPRLDPGDFDRERRLQLASLKQGPDSVGWIARRVLPMLLHGDEHPYGSPAQGFTTSVERLELGDVRRYREEHVGPRGAILVVVGDVDPERVFAMLEKTLGGWRPQSVVPGPRPASEGASRPGVVHFVDKPGAVQSILAVARRWVDRGDSRYFAAQLGNRILGGDFLSRLNQNLREKHGYTYGAHSYFRFARTGSVWSLATEVRTDATVEASKEALSELEAIGAARPFTAEELATAIDAESRSFPDAFESPGSIADALGEVARFGLPANYLDTVLPGIQSTTLDGAIAVMREIVDPRGRVMLVVGDRKKVEPQLRAKGFTEIRFLTTDGQPAGRP